MMGETPVDDIDSKSDPDSISVELSSRRTGMSLQRTRMSADRTLMSVISTSLGLISFGFTIFQVFQKLHEQAVVSSVDAPRNFGLALVALGIGMIAIGIAYHVWFMYGLRETRKTLKAAGLVYGESSFPPSMTLIVAVVLLLIGIVAIVSMVTRVGPFG